MEQTHTLVIGASIAGLATAAALQKHGIEHIIIEKQSEVAAPWRNHYERLHLHTNKSLSNLPYKKFGSSIPRYPSRQQVVDYLDDYRKTFNIQPVFNTEAKSVKRELGHWVTETNKGVFQSKYVIMATGAYGKPKPVNIKGMQTFGGKILHSYGYKSGRDFKGQQVLVIGFGNSACEIAIDLYEQGAAPSMSVRSAVNVIPRDLFGIPILQLSQLMAKLPPRLADILSAPMIRLSVGDITKLGLRKLPYGAFEEIKKMEQIPLLDIGTIKHIKEGHIKIFDDIDHIEEDKVFFVDGKTEHFDAIIAGIGYYRDYAEIVAVDKSRFDDLKLPVSEQKYFGWDNLYFCGFFISPTGQIKEIASDAKMIANDIAVKEDLGVQQ